jgi:hypothetical protein
MERPSAEEPHDAHPKLYMRHDVPTQPALHMGMYTSPQRSNAIQAFQAAIQSNSSSLLSSTSSSSSSTAKLSSKQQAWLVQQAAIQQATKMQQASIQAFKQALMVTQNKPPRPHQPRQATQDMEQFDANFDARHGNFGGKSPLEKNDRNFETTGELGSEEALSSVSGGMHSSHTDPALNLGQEYSRKKRERICFSKEEKEAVLNHVRQGIGACSTNMRLNNLYKDAAKLLTKSATGDINHDAKIVKNVVKKSRVKGDARLKSAFNRINNTKGRGSHHHDKKSTDESDDVRDDDNSSLSSGQLAPAPGIDDRPDGLSTGMDSRSDGLSNGTDSSGLEKLSESDKIEEEAAAHRACVDEQQASYIRQAPPADSTCHSSLLDRQTRPMTSDNDSVHGASEYIDPHLQNVMIGDTMQHIQHAIDRHMQHTDSVHRHMQHTDSVERHIHTDAGTAIANDGKDSESVNTALFDGVMRGV